ncbi:MAG: 5-formyltetrahydrofolate cyclo-ligase [Peptococcaceae bacterium]|nr:5-formyltetrahydrofolate cyclo-ligase [Candidatus Syntrophopropionicum ammoniitolerans]
MPLESKVIKEQLRSSIINKRNILTPQQVDEKSALIIGRLLSLDEYCQARSVMVYLDFRREVGTAELVKHALADGKNVAAPLTDIAKGLLTPALIVDFPADLQPGAWGILEPGPQSKLLDPATLDLVITPGVAFDLSGYRIGYGHGFYDRFLPRTGKDTVYIGLAYEFQIQPDVFPQAHDVPVDIILTEERVIRVTKCT